MRVAWLVPLTLAAICVASAENLPCVGLRSKTDEGFKECEKTIKEACEGTKFELVAQPNGRLIFQEGIFFKVSFRKQGDGEIRKTLARLVRGICQPAVVVGSVTKTVKQILSPAKDESSSAQAAFALLHSIQGAPKSLDDVRKMFHSAQLRVEAKRDLNINIKEVASSVKIAKATQLGVRLRASRLTVVFHPTIQLKKNLMFGIGPTVDVKSMTLDLSAEPTWSFKAEGFGIDGVYEYILSWLASDWLGPMLPARLQAGYYSVKTDHRVEATIASLQKSLMDKLGSDGPSTASVPINLSDLHNAYFDMSIQTKAKLFVPWKVKNGEDSMDMRVDVPKYTIFSLDAQTTGPVTRPKLKYLLLRVGRSGIEVNNVGTGAFDSVKGLTVVGLKILPRGKVRLLYDLQAEGALTGLIGLVQIMGMGAQLRTGHDLGVRDLKPVPVRIKVARDAIDEKVSVALEPMVAKFVQQYDTIVPGVSLMSILDGEDQ